MNITLISHPLCPYVQRAVISLEEKGISYQRIDIDLANKPDWFLALSPLGKTPVLKVDEDVLFESNVILEYLEDILVHPLHPQDALLRARHRSMIEFSSAILNDIAGLYNAKTEPLFQEKRQALRKKFIWLEDTLQNRTWFSGETFSLVDVVFGPVFRYFDTLDQLTSLNIFEGLPKTQKWRKALQQRKSIQQAVSPDYPERLHTFLQKRSSYLSTQLAA